MIEKSGTARITAGGIIIGNAEGYTVTERRDIFPVREFGSGGGILARGVCGFEIVLRLAAAFDSSAAEKIRGLDDFELILERVGRTAVYTGCRWEEITEDCGAKGVRITAKLRASAGALTS